ncbi:Lnb N-terminal periplasmic domain-containing protein [Zobellia laminariae]|uniref:Lnb N-terminal periplasmic domain-containing protein n=1 Tax=Zobellia laminariae TaxID=248906 RepID=UPI003EF82CCA
MQLKKIIFILLFSLSVLGFSQAPELTPLSKISVVTCGPGSELYSTFGHSAIHIEDTSLGINAIYNYGTFDFTTPNFYMKFVRGKLDYTLARQSFPYFLKEYEYENRWVRSQELQLTLTERQELFNFLETNYLPENRDYKYDFFYNNCATKIWDILNEVYGDKLVFDKNYLKELHTHRQLIRQKVKINSWSGFGIDLALGSVIDDIATPKEHMFLPDYIMEQLDVAQLNGQPLVAKSKVLLEANSEDSASSFFISPELWLIVLLIIILVLTYFDFKNNTRRRWLDFILFFSTGIIGLLIVFLWFFTDHSATAGNFNILWAFPPNLIIAFIVAQKRGPNWIAKYAIFLAILIVVSGILWMFGLQLFSPLILAIWAALIARYLFLFWSYHKPKIA